MSKKVKITLASLLAASTIGGGAYQQGVFTTPPEYSSMRVERKTITESLTLTGEVSAHEKVTLRFQSSGRLSWVGVKEGDFVKKYQTIATLDQRELQKKLARDLISFRGERWDLDQQREDYEGMAITDEFQRIIDKTQFDLDKSIIDVELQDLSIQYSRLFTPIEGIVTKVGAPYAGVNMTPAQAEFEIVNPKTLYFEAKVDQTEVVLIREGVNGTLLLDAHPDRDFNATVDTIGILPKTNENTTVYAVKISFLQNDDTANLRLGMTGDVTFPVKSTSNVLTISTSYLQSDDKGYFVYMGEAKTKTKNYIEIGVETDDDVQVISGLKEGAVIYDTTETGVEGSESR